MATFDFSKHKVLMVDRDSKTFERAKAIYELKGLSDFKGVTSANAAMGAIKNFAPSLAFINADPGAGGHELIQMLRDFPDGRFNDLPIVVMLTKVETRQLKDLCRIGIEGALRKPIDPVRLLRLTRLTIRRPQRFISIRNYFGPNRRTRSQAPADGYDRRIKHDGPEEFVPRQKKQDNIRMVPIEHHGINKDGITMVPIVGVGINDKEITMVPIEGHQIDKDGVTWVPVEGFGGKDGITMVPIEGREGRNGDISFAPIEGFGMRDDLTFVPIEGNGNAGEGITMIPIKGYGGNGNEPDYKYADQKEFAADLEVTPVGTLSDEGELSSEAIQSFKDKGEIAFDQLGPGDDGSSQPDLEANMGGSVFDQSFEDAMREAKGMAGDGAVSHDDLVGGQKNGEMEIVNSGDLLTGASGPMKKDEAKPSRRPPPSINLDLDIDDDEPAIKPDDVVPVHEKPPITELMVDSKGMVELGSLEELVAEPELAKVEGKEPPASGGFDVAAALNAAQNAKGNLTKKKREKEKAARIAEGKAKAEEALKKVDEKLEEPTSKAKPKRKPKAKKETTATKAKPTASKPTKKKAPAKKAKAKEVKPEVLEEIKPEPKRRGPKTASAPEVQIALGAHKLWVNTGGKEGAQLTLPRADMRGHNLAESDFTQVRIPGGNFKGTDCTETVFRKAFLSRSDFTGAQLSKCDFAVSRLKQVNLKDAKLKMANLHGADLARANLSGARLMRCDMSAANLDGTNLIGANLSSVKGLLPDQLLRARIDSTTKLPYHLRSNQKLEAATKVIANKKKTTRRTRKPKAK
ncbi:MAG: pentapeptide repeat-containing protein [Alphaproteobacteria bacterium]|nr:pentapeptide repeat-containing protein [Alphaproteobacteria bacterium]